MNVFDLQAKIGINTSEYKKGLTDASKDFSEFGGKIKDGAAKLAKISTAALGAAAAGVGALVKQSVGAYAEYEQLVGGIETLFGKNAETVLKNSEKAFATAGMSVNEYMETSIQGAAALINSLGGDTSKAAELMDVSIQDMSDNVNKIGTSMESIQNAYRGFSRQNFTMLDNLSLGFAGTKEGMQQLLDKAKEISGIDYNIESYADIVQAIHVVQTEMGITGTTAKEAAGTITGSLSSVKAAWKNLTIEMAKENGDIGGSFKTLGDNVGAFAENMLPRVEQSLNGVSKLITESAPQISTSITTVLPRVIPALIKSAGSIIGAVGQGVMQATPALLNMGRAALENIAFLTEDLDFSDSIISKILGSVVDNAPAYFMYGEKILANLADAILNVDYKKLGSSLSSVFSSAVNSITDLVKDIDFYKVGEDIADFLNGIDWQNDVADPLLDLLAAGIKAIPDIAVSFFANADLENLMTMIGVLGAPKLLGGLTDYISSDEGQGLGSAAGSSWSGAFMAGVKAFGLGWAIGSYLRESIDWDDKTYGEHTDDAMTGDEVLDYGSKSAVSGTGLWGLAQAFKTINETAKDKENLYTYTNRYGQKVTIDKYDEFGNYTDTYKKVAMQGPQLPKFGNGGRVTQPTIALIGEKEPETIVPDSKRNQFGTNQTFNITINGVFNADDPESRRALIEEMSREMANLSISQKRAVGGVGW